MNLYCEKVTLAKNDGQYATNSFEGNEPLSLPQFTTRFEEFLDCCESLAAKRVSVQFKLQHIDGQVSINHLLSFIFQIIYRVLNDMATQPGTSAAKKVQLSSLVENVKLRYDEASIGLRLVTKNIDFAQLGISLCLRSGAQGVVSLSCRDILAQAPLLLKLNILTDKNLGAIPLVPYIVSFKPQENGDILLDVSVGAQSC
jgi:hypothetical protein